MNKFKIEVKETLSKVIEIEAENVEEAIQKVSESYQNEKIILDSEDYVDTSIKELK